ncbi:triose-phosphate isomerase [Candidatus Kaiserbacteria bacterium]|nr:triose-phosphate isomerase [Candidatus Kaiserbacteria bacterium]
MQWLVVANWKMNPGTAAAALSLFEATKKASEKARNATIIIAPPAIFLPRLRTSYRGKKVQFGIQHGHFEHSGSYTGEISLTQAKDAGASWAIIGHAERRAVGETDEDVCKQVVRALTLKMTPILCIGEKVRSASGDHLHFIKEQLRIGLADVSPAKLGKIVIAYEPVWAIGAAEAMQPRDMHEMAIFIRKTIVDTHGKPGLSVKILYGGSIDETNAGAMLREGDVQGLLVGRASADAAQFAHLVSAIEKA